MMWLTRHNRNRITKNAACRSYGPLACTVARTVAFNSDTSKSAAISAELTGHPFRHTPLNGAASAARRARLKQKLAAWLDRSHPRLVAGPKTRFTIVGLVAHFDLLESRRDASPWRSSLFEFPNNAPAYGQSSPAIQTALPANQPVECHHQSEGEARDANEDDAKEYAMHVLITAAALLGSVRRLAQKNTAGLEIRCPGGCLFAGPLKSPAYIA